MSEIRVLLRPLLARRLSPAERRHLAAELLALAAEQERLAAADERVGHQVRRGELERQAAPCAAGRPRGSGARFVRWEPPVGEGKVSRRSGHLHIGRALWQELGEPRRMDVQRLGAELHIRPCAEGVGWAISRSERMMPRLNIGDEPATNLRLVEGRHDGEIRGGAIVVRM